MNRPLPPALAAALLLVAVPLGVVAPGLGPLSPPGRVFGLLPLVWGFGVTRSAHNLFARLGTEIGTFNEPGLLVVTGPFAYTRNPMYLGMAVALAGVALLVGSLTAWLAPVGFALVANQWYIPFEEGRMEAAFGREYEAYRSLVPRWFGPRGRARELTHDGCQ